MGGLQGGFIGFGCGYCNGRAVYRLVDCHEKPTSLRGRPRIYDSDVAAFPGIDYFRVGIVEKTAFYFVSDGDDAAAFDRRVCVEICSVENEAA